MGEIALPGRHALARYLVERWCDEPNVESPDSPAPPPSVAMTDDREMPLVPTTNRSFAFRVVEMNLSADQVRRSAHGAAILADGGRRARPR